MQERLGKGVRRAARTTAGRLIENLEQRLFLAGQSFDLNFDKLAPGTVITNQFSKQGVVFSGLNVRETVAADGGAHSGGNVLNISTSVSLGVSPTPNLTGQFSGNVDDVSMFVGAMSAPLKGPISGQAVLTAFSSNGKIVAQSKVPITSTKFSQLIEVSTKTAIIRRFVLTGSGAPIGADDIQYHFHPGFTITPAHSSVTVGVSSSVNDNLTLARLFGSTGNITFSASGLPSGVSAIFTPTTVTTGTSTQLQLVASSAAVATPPSGVPITITGTPASSSVADGPLTATITLNVVPALTATFDQSSFTVIGASAVGFTVQRGPGFSGGFNMSLTGLPAGMTGRISPVFAAPGSGPVSGFVTFTPSTTTPLGPTTVTLHVTDGPITATATISVTVRQFSLTSFSPASGNAPQLLQPGTLLTLHGVGLDLVRSVQFGNVDALATPISVTGGGTTLTARVPRLATNGHVTIIAVNGSTWSNGVNFTVHSFRNTNGYSFSNFNVGGVTWDDMVQAFGFDQTHIWGTPIPDPLAAIMWGIAAATLNDGQCFGVSLSSSRFRGGIVPLNFFLTQPGLPASTVWNLQGPDIAGGGGGPSSALAHLIHIDHLQQLSTQYLLDYVADVGVHATLAAVSGATAADLVRSEVTSKLNLGITPIIAISDSGSGHAILGYDIENDPSDPHGFFIDCYDPNEPFFPSENSDAAEHMDREQVSRVHVRGNGTWEFLNLQEPNSGPNWHGPLGSLAVASPRDIPVVPALPTSPASLAHIIFGTGATTTQITDAAGHTLLDKAGNQNNNIDTRIPDSAVFFPDHGENLPSIPLDLLGNSGPFKQTVTGTGDGVYSQSYIDGSFAIKVANVVSTKGIVDSLTYDTKTASLLFHTAAESKTARIQLAGDTDSGDRSATFDLKTFSSGDDRFAFGSGMGALTFSHHGPSTTFNFLLQEVGSKGDGGSFSSRPIPVLDSDVVTITPSNWQNLGTGAISIVILHKGGKKTTLEMGNQGTGETIQATEGVAFDTIIAKFVDGSVKPQPVGAIIDWGDGTTSLGNVIPNAADNTFELHGTHTYLQPQTYVITAQFGDAEGPLGGEVRSIATVAPMKFKVVAINPTPTVGKAFTGPVATFADPNIRAGLGDVNTTINWGDGTSSAGELTQIKPGVFTVSGRHTFSKVGALKGSVRISDSPAMLLGGSAFSATKGKELAGPITMTSIPVGAHATDYQAMIAWGDGTTSVGLLSVNGDGLLVIEGKHVYTKSGDFTPVVQLLSGPGVTVPVTFNVLK
ncbi:MAG TPA: IPT/TIG domain-containing protein [Humisphaera sp.]|nr:IPT/TIG domain-containing protein [Humisphaera sp.]